MEKYSNVSHSHTQIMRRNREDEQKRHLNLSLRTDESIYITQRLYGRLQCRNYPENELLISLPLARSLTHTYVPRLLLCTFHNILFNASHRYLSFFYFIRNATAIFDSCMWIMHVCATVCVCVRELACAAHIRADEKHEKHEKNRNEQTELRAYGSIDMFECKEI